MPPVLGRDDFLLVLPSDPQSLAVVRAVTEALTKLAGHNSQSRYEVVLAVHEACSNVIEHAHNGNRELPITLSGRILDDGVEFRLLDEGPPFDFASVPELDPTEVRHGGRGAVLMRQYLDEVSSTVRPEGGNELRMYRRVNNGSE